MIRQFDGDYPLHVYIARLEGTVWVATRQHRGGDDIVMHSWPGCPKKGLSPGGLVEKSIGVLGPNARWCKDCTGESLARKNATGGIPDHIQEIVGRLSQEEV